MKNGLFLAQNLFMSNFFIQIQTQRLKIDPCAKFQPDCTKDKGAPILTWNNTENWLMTSYLPHSDDVSKIMAFERFCPIVLSYYQSTIN